MTIKEMQKLYKNIKKYVDLYNESMWNLANENYQYKNSWEAIEERLKNLNNARSATLKLIKFSTVQTTIGGEFLEPIHCMIEAVNAGEDSFVRWCILHNVDWKVQEEEEEEEEGTEE